MVSLPPPPREPVVPGTSEQATLPQRQHSEAEFRVAVLKAYILGSTCSFERKTHPHPQADSIAEQSARSLYEHKSSLVGLRHDLEYDRNPHAKQIEELGSQIKPLAMGDHHVSAFNVGCNLLAILDYPIDSPYFRHLPGWVILYEGNMKMFNDVIEAELGKGVRLND